MARRIRSKLEHRTSRLVLRIRGKPYWLQIGEGLYQGYRRCQGNGSWSGRKSDGRGGNFIKKVGPADDFENVPGALDYWQAQQKIRELFLGGTSHDSGKLVTVAEAIRDYRDDLATRGGGPGNASILEFHVSPALKAKIVAALTARECKAFRKELLDKGLAPATVTRTCKALAAAFSLAAAHDPRIKNRDAWRIGLAALPDSSTARNVILPDDTVRRVVSTAGHEGEAFALFVEVLALSGCRPVQARRLLVGDVLRDKLMMPSSKKGKGQRRIERKPMPIPLGLAARLKQVGKGRAAGDPLLLKADGKPWGKNDHRDPMRRTAERCGLDPDEVTIYSLRHSSIVRQLLKAVPIRLVADQHDTSVSMIEKTYSKYISHHGDDLLRAAQLDLTVPIADKVVPLR